MKGIGGERMKVNILGSKWEIKHRTKEQDIALENRAGYTDHTTQTMVIRIYPVDKYNDLDSMQVFKNKVIRHEIVHAFLFESGLAENSTETGSWAKNEEMVDWFAFQGPKIYKAWSDAGALPEEMGYALERTPNAVRQKAITMGIKGRL